MGKSLSPTTTHDERQILKRSKTKEYLEKIDDGNFICRLYKEVRNPHHVIILREKGGWTLAQWRHLRKFHGTTFNKILGKWKQKYMLDMFQKSKPSKLRYAGITNEQIKNELVQFIIHTYCLFTLMETLALKRLLSYLGNVMLRFLLQIHYKILLWRCIMIVKIC